jgi:trigger factor
MQQYMMFTGMTEEKMMEELQPQAVKRIQTRLVLEAIAKAENIEISDERLDEEIQKMAEAYNMEADKLKEYMGEEEKKQMKEDIAVQEAVTLITEAAVEK